MNILWVKKNKYRLHLQTLTLQWKRKKTLARSIRLYGKKFWYKNKHFAHSFFIFKNKIRGPRYQFGVALDNVINIFQFWIWFLIAFLTAQRWTANDLGKPVHPLCPTNIWNQRKLVLWGSGGVYWLLINGLIFLLTTDFLSKILVTTDYSAVEFND